MKKRILVLISIMLIIIISGSIILSSAFETDTVSTAPSAHSSCEPGSYAPDNIVVTEDTATPIKLIYPDTSSIHGSSTTVQEGKIANTITYRKINLQSNAAASQYSNTERLTYTETEVYPNGKAIDLYLSEEQCVYYFNKDEKFIGWKLPNDQWHEIVKNFSGKEAAVSDEEAVEIADKVVEFLFSDVSDIVTYDRVHYDNSGWYSVRYYEKLGKGDFINGLYCCILIAGDGTVFSATMYNYDDVSDFDGSLLNSITEDHISDLANVHLNRKYAEHSDEITNFSLEGARLVCIDGKTVIEADYHFELPGWSGRIQTIADSCYIEIID